MCELLCEIGGEEHEVDELYDMVVSDLTSKHAPTRWIDVLELAVDNLKGMHTTL